MLNNLKGMHCRGQNWELALRVQQRLVALSPADYDAQFDLGRLALYSNAPGLAYDVFLRCVAHPLQQEPQRLQDFLREAERGLAVRN